MSRITIVRTPNDQSLVAEIVEKASKLYGTNKSVCFAAKDKDELFATQKRVNAYAVRLGFRMKTMSDGLKLYVTPRRRLADHEIKSLRMKPSLSMASESRLTQ